MDWSTIIVGGLAVLGSLIGTYFSNRKTTALIVYRIEQLEKKVDEHNNFGVRIPVLEAEVDALGGRIHNLEKGVRK